MEDLWGDFFACSNQCPLPEKRSSQAPKALFFSLVSSQPTYLKVKMSASQKNVLKFSNPKTWALNNYKHYTLQAEHQLQTTEHAANRAAQSSSKQSTKPCKTAQVTIRLHHTAECQTTLEYKICSKTTKTYKKSRKRPEEKRTPKSSKISFKKKKKKKTLNKTHKNCTYPPFPSLHATRPRGSTALQGCSPGHPRSGAPSAAIRVTWKTPTETTVCDVCDGFLFLFFFCWVFLYVFVFCGVF